MKIPTEQDVATMDESRLLDLMIELPFLGTSAVRDLRLAARRRYLEIRGRVRVRISAEDPAVFRAARAAAARLGGVEIEHGDHPPSTSGPPSDWTHSVDAIGAARHSWMFDRGAVSIGVRVGRTFDRPGDLAVLVIYVAAVAVDGRVLLRSCETESMETEEPSLTDVLYDAMAAAISPHHT